MDLETVVIVDDEDCVIGKASRQQMRQQRLLHRVTFILVFSSVGQLLVQKRTETKDIYPGLLDLAAGGVVHAGEEYDISAQRELAEELGVTNQILKPCFKLFFQDSFNQNWGQVFSCITDGPFVLQGSEVTHVKFYDIESILAFDCATVTPDTRRVVEYYVESI